MSGDHLNIGIAGLGSVGSAVLRLLQENHDHLTVAAGKALRVIAVSARDRMRDRGVDLSQVKWYDDPRDLANDPAVDVVVELIGGADGAAFDTVKTALQNGKTVVTGNKAMLSQRAAELKSLLEQHGGSIAFEAAVAGGIPAIKAVREGLSANRIATVAGILNGTCNFILSTMDVTGRDFADVLAEAQKLGYAEADPSFDVDGIDTAHKLSILAALAFGGLPDIDAISIKGIRNVTPLDLQAARSFGFTIKLLGVATPTSSTVAPVLVPLHSPVGGVNGPLNTVSIRGNFSGAVTLTGAGAGGNATASAVVADLVDVARGQILPLFPVPVAKPASNQSEIHESRFYIRAENHAPSVFAAIEDAGIALPQKHSGAGAALTVLTTRQKLMDVLSHINEPVAYFDIEENL